MKYIISVLISCMGIIDSVYAAEHDVILDATTNVTTITAGRIGPGEKINVKFNLINPSNSNLTPKFKGSCSCMIVEKLGGLAAKSSVPVSIELKAPNEVGRYEFVGLFFGDNFIKAGIGRKGIVSVKFILDVFDGIQTIPNAIDVQNITQNDFLFPMSIGDVEILLADSSIDPSTLKLVSRDEHLRYELERIYTNKFIAHFQLFGKNIVPGSYRSNIEILGTGPLINYRKKLPVSYFINRGWEPYPRSVILRGSNPSQRKFEIKIKIPPDIAAKGFLPSLKYSQELKVTVERAGGFEWLLRGELLGIPQEKNTQLMINLSDTDGRSCLQIPIYCVKASKQQLPKQSTEAER